MEKKEYYKHILPHFQQPGQAYFVTWILKDAIPPHALKRYTEKLTLLKAQIEGAGAGSGASDSIRRFTLGAEVSNFRKNHEYNPCLPTGQARHSNVMPCSEIEKLLKEYHLLRKKYIKAYDDLLAVTKSETVDLSKPEIQHVIAEALMFWEGKKLETQAFCIMPNHVHWVFKLKEKDDKGKPVYLQDIMHSIKRHTANQINKSTGMSGALWQKESFDTTIRNLEHEYNAIRYTLNNPVAAGFVKEWKEWPGNWYCEGSAVF